MKKEPIEKLKQKVHEMKKEAKVPEETDPKDKKIEELTESLQRLQAEFENYKKYIDNSKKDMMDYAKANMIDKILPILDSFEMALKNYCDKEKFVKGVELIYSQLYTMLEKEGLRKIAAEGKLNPNLHDVLLKEKSDKEEDTILEELQKGYMLGDKVLRYARVKVSK
ncbi:MAG: nucleotide exchange factor GrpE [Nanoarchaeota archaeon]